MLRAKVAHDLFQYDRIGQLRRFTYSHVNIVGRIVSACRIHSDFRWDQKMYVLSEVNSTVQYGTIHLGAFLVFQQRREFANVPVPT